MFGRGRPPASKTSEEENPFLLSFSDLMASLLAIFILALVVMMIELSRKKAELDKQNSKVKKSIEELRNSLVDIRATQDRIGSALKHVTRREHTLASLLTGMQKDLAARGIHVEVAEGGTVLRIPEDQLHFPLGRYAIQPEFSQSAEVVGAALLKYLEHPKSSDLLDTVFVEGHTDAVPSSKEMGNWGLSTYRAISLWNFWTADPGTSAKLADLRAASGRSLISVSGYGDTRPVAGTDHEIPEQPKNRRIDIRFTLASKERGDLEGVREDIHSLKRKTDELIDSLKQVEE